MPCVYMHVNANEAAIIQNDDTCQAACLTRAVSAYGYMRICVFLSRPQFCFGAFLHPKLLVNST